MKKLVPEHTYTVCCITPTTDDRNEFNKRISQIFDAQDYPYREHLFDFGNGSIGAKRNRLIESSKSDIVLHMDSDDLYSSDWISRSVKHLVDSNADLVGLSNTFIYDVHARNLYEYRYAGNQPYVRGGTMCYWKDTWKRNNFKDISKGEDDIFCANAGKVVPMDYMNGFVAILHGNNTCGDGCVRFAIKEVRALPLSSAPQVLIAHLPIRH